MLHITNGDIAVQRIRDAGALGDIVPWNDVLHEGPVPAEIPPEELRRIRAAFIASQGWDDEGAALAMLEERDATLDAVDQSDEWDAFRAPDPRSLATFSRGGLPFPFMAAALRRHLEQFPSVEDGPSPRPSSAIPSSHRTSSVSPRTRVRSCSCSPAGR